MSDIKEARKKINPLEKPFSDSLIRMRKKVENLLIDLKTVKSQYKQEKEDLKKSKTHLTHVEEAQNITQQIAQTIQQQAHDKIAGVVSRCLEAVFDDANYGFKIDFEKKRGKAEAKLILLKDGNEIPDPLEADSGGVIDIAALALRLSCLVLTKPKLRRALIMDEPFKNVSPNYRENVRTLLEKLSKEFKIQFIMVTHEIEFQTGKVIRL